jgi:hypothetical protein
MRSINENEAGASGEHEQQPGPGPKKVSIAPHWAAILSLVAIGVLYGLLPTKVSIGPSWLLMAIEGVFLLPFVIATLTRRMVSPVTLRVGSLILLGLVTLTLVVGIGHLISTLKGDVSGIALIYSGLLLYCFNVLVSALWYWEIDGGGPEKRQQSDHQAADFMFPQQGGNTCIDHHFVCCLSCNQHCMKKPEHQFLFIPISTVTLRQRSLVTPIYVFVSFCIPSLNQSLLNSIDYGSCSARNSNFVVKS